MASQFRGDLIRSGGNAKTIKGDKLTEYETAIMYLSPADLVQGVNLCPFAEIAGCKQACLNSAGRAALFASIPKARAAKTVRYRDNRAKFMADLVKDIEKFVRYCERKGVKPAVRLNGTSDIQWERGHVVERKVDYFQPGPKEPRVLMPRMVVFQSIFEAFPEVQFYDYTKIANRVTRKGTLPANYSLTLSYSEANTQYADRVIKAAHDADLNVAVVFRSKARAKLAIEQGFKGLQVIDGDETDARFLDKQGGYVVALYAKGQAKTDQSGFVMD